MNHNISENMYTVIHYMDEDYIFLLHSTNLGVNYSICILIYREF